MRKDIRWGLVTTMVVVIGGLAAAGIWLWQRPAAMAEAAVSDVTTAAAVLEPELVALADLNTTLTDTEIDNSAIAAQTLSVEGQARSLFDAAGALPVGASSTRAEATDAATSALDAARLVSDAAAYRSAVISILISPDLETDPELIGLDDAVRGFGEWQQNFNEVRSALPSETMRAVADQLEVIAADLESIQSAYIDGLREDDRLAAEAALEDLAARLETAEELLSESLEQVQEQVSALIEDSLTGVDRLLG